MNYLWKTLAVSALAAVMLAGCAGGNTVATLPAVDEKPVASGTQAGVTYVSTVQELTAALVPGAVVELGEGTYTLAPESGSNLQTNNSYCRWNSVYDGYELVLSDVSNVTIRGAGKEKTRLECDPRGAAVLTLKNCKNVTLEGFTAGHTQRAEGCEGNVINLEDCGSVSMRELGLYGCGSMGINAYNCQKLSVKDTDIYECSSVGVSLNSVSNCAILDSTIRNIGDGQAYCALSAWYGDGLELVGTDFVGNNVNTLVDTDQNIRFTNCGFRENKVESTVFRVSQNYRTELIDLTLEKCTGRDNSAWGWYTLDNGTSIVNESGKALTEEALDECFGKITTNIPKTTQPQETVVVKTADEFLAALGSNKDIVIDTPLLDLSTATSYQSQIAGEGYYWTDPFDGPELTICELDNLTIRGKDGKAANVISAVPRYAQVLRFQNCSNVTVEDLTAGHTKEPGYCIGGVLDFEGCGNVTVTNTGLFGCGTIGIIGNQCRNMELTDNEIYECSYGGISLGQVKYANMKGNTFRDLGDEYGTGYIYSFTGCADLTFDGSSVPGNDYLEYTAE